MENKKWYKRSATMFWFLLASLPFWLPVIITIANYLIHTDSLSLTDIQSLFTDNTWSNNFNNICNQVGSYTPGVLKNSMNSMIQAFDENININLSIALSWFAWTYFLHLLIDVIVWLPKLFHSWIARYE